MMLIILIIIEAIITVKYRSICTRLHDGTFRKTAILNLLHFVDRRTEILPTSDALVGEKFLKNVFGISDQ